MVTVSKLTSLGEAIASEFREKNVTFLAGSLAYTAFVSLVPLLLFFLFALALVGPGWEQQFLTLVVENVSATVGQFIEKILQRQAADATGPSVLGATLLVWGALKLFRGLDTAFEEIYEVDADTSIVDQLRDGGVVLLSLVCSAGAIVAATTLFSAVAGSIPYARAVVPSVLTVGLILAFFPMYYVFPDVDVTPREIIPGAIVAAVGWSLLQVLFQVYVTFSTGGDGIGLVTGVMLLLTWLYCCGIVLLLGVVVNAVLGGYAENAAEAGVSSAPAD